MVTVTNKLYFQEDGNVAYAGEINSDKSFILNNMLNFIEDGAASTSQHNLFDEDFSSTTAINTTSSTCKYSSSFNICFADVGSVYDDYSDSSIDTTKWTVTFGGSDSAAAVKSSSESDSPNISITSESYITCSSVRTGSGDLSVTLESTGSGDTMDLSPSTGTDGEAIFALSVNSSGPNTNTRTVSLVGSGGGSVTLYSTTSANISGTMRLVFSTGDVCDVYYNDFETKSSTVSTSTLSGSWYLKLYAHGSSGSNSQRSESATLRIVRNANASNTVSASYYLSTMSTSSSTNNIMFAKYYLGSDGTYTTQQSFDNGSHYSTISNEILSSVENSGTQHISKITMPGGALTYIPYITALRYYYS